MSLKFIFKKLEEEKLLNGSPHSSPLPGAEREKIEKVVENRIKSVKADLEKQVGGLTTERDAVMSRLVEIEINQGVTLAATKRGLRPTAIPDAVARARKVFQLVNGVPTAFEPDGKSVPDGRDGVTSLTLDEDRPIHPRSPRRRQLCLNRPCRLRPRLRERTPTTPSR